MLLVRYHLDVFAAPSENIAKPSPGDQSTYWNQKTQVSTQLAYIISASTPTASSAWIPMPCTRRMVRMGAFGFHGPLIESQGFDINGSVTASSTNLFWGSQAPDYGSLATIFAGKARLRQNICASHIFDSTSGVGRMGYSYTTDFTTTLWFGLLLRVDYWDGYTDNGRVTIGNSRLHARTFVR
jgi:hypothetical protein